MTREEIARKLKDGWTVAGYSTVIMAAGAMNHSTLFQKGEKLEICNVVVSNGRELGRSTTVIS